MWGSAFADLAKKVEEQASVLSAFNLDAMQQGDGSSSNKDGAAAKQRQERERVQQPPSSTRPAPPQQQKQQQPSRPIPTPPSRFDSGGSTNSNFVFESSNGSSNNGASTPITGGLYGFTSMLTTPEKKKNVQKQQPKPKKQQQEEPDFFSDWGNQSETQKKEKTKEPKTKLAMQTVAAVSSSKPTVAAVSSQSSTTPKKNDGSIKEMPIAAKSIHDANEQKEDVAVKAMQKEQVVAKLEETPAETGDEALDEQVEKEATPATPNVAADSEMEPPVARETPATPGVAPETPATPGVVADASEKKVPTPTTPVHAEKKIHEEAFDSFLDVDENEAEATVERVEAPAEETVEPAIATDKDAEEPATPDDTVNQPREDLTASKEAIDESNEDAFQTPPKPDRSVSDDDNLLSPDIKQVVTEISETSAQFEEVLHHPQEGPRHIKSPTSDNGSIAMELNNLADSEEELRQELEESGMEQLEEKEEGTAEKDASTMESDATDELSVQHDVPTEEPDAGQTDKIPVSEDTEDHAELVHDEQEQAVLGDKEIPSVEEEPVASLMERGSFGEQELDASLMEREEVEPSSNEEPMTDDNDEEEALEEDTFGEKESLPSQEDGGEASSKELPTTETKDEITLENGTNQPEEAPTAADTLSDNVMGMFSSQFQMLSPFATETKRNYVQVSPLAAHNEQPETDSKQDPGAAVSGVPSNGTTESNANRDNSIQNDATGTLDNAVPDHIIEMFSAQIQRLEEYHASELKEMEQRHASELDAASKHDECFKKMRQLEKEYRVKLSESDEQISELMQKNEGMTLKVDVLQRELDGTKAILDKRESDFGQATETHSRDVHEVEQKLKDVEGAASASAAEVERLKEALKTSKEELEASNDAFAKLKGRVKVVATELKERRVECRGLHTNVAELKIENESLQTQIDNLQSQLKEQNRVRMESNEGMAVLRSRVEELESELSAAEKKLKDRDAVGEKALASYKKKAQTALAAANARAAAANHAREEAELEASAVRSSGEQALERARVAERNAKETVLLAEKKTEALAEQNKVLMNTLSEANDSWKKAEEELQLLRTEMEGSDSSREKLVGEIATISHELDEERAKTMELTHELNETRAICNSLRNETEILREEVQRTAAAAVMAVQRDSTADMGAGGVSPSVLNDGDGNVHSASNGGKSPGEGSESEATIFMLQQELDEANEAIKELKEALKGSLANSQDVPHSPENVASPRSYDSYGTTEMHPASHGDQGNDSTPLFYALEKQAELNTARDEITRLANLLGDAESAKMEAYDAMEEMRMKMEEAEARLRRHEKLGQGASRAVPRSTAGARGGPQGHAPGSSGTRPGGSSDQNGTHEEWNGNDSNVNLEYLKNVMLSYLNAKTLAERRALVPVLSAVLELTPDEEAKALRNVEESGELNGVGNAFLESLGSKVQQLM